MINIFSLQLKHQAFNVFYEDASIILDDLNIK
jgi:hypothetical protein